MNLENSRAFAGNPDVRVASSQMNYSRDSLAKSQLGRPSPAGRAFVGGFIRRVTPVPIPNTVVKPAEPMILLQRESRSLPALNKSPGLRKKIGALFLSLAFCEPDLVPEPACLTLPAIASIALVRRMHHSTVTATGRTIVLLPPRSVSSPFGLITRIRK